MSNYHLNNLAGGLKDANEEVSTQKRINSLSDDPVGLTQVMNINSTLDNLEQIGTNVAVGKNWLDASETALNSVSDLILEVKSEVSRLASASSTADERFDAVERINGIIEQLVSLGNTQLSGSYVFSGTDTGTASLVYDGSVDPPLVTYGGNTNPFVIQSDKFSTVEVGRSGSTIFWSDAIDINSTNNTIVFKEDNGHGSASEITMTTVVPEGEYTAKQLGKAIEDAVNKASQEDGYGITYVIEFDDESSAYSIREDGSYDGYMRTQFLWESGEEAYVNGVTASQGIDPDDVDVTVLNKDSLTIETSEPMRIVWAGDETWRVQNNPGYIIVPSTISGTDTEVGIDLDEDGDADIQIRLAEPVTEEGQYIEFDIVTATNDTSVGNEIGFSDTDIQISPAVSDGNPVFTTDITIRDGDNDIMTFEEVNSTGGVSTISIDLNTSGADMVYADINALALHIETTMEAASLGFGNAIDYAVTYDSDTSKFTIREDGTNLNELRLLWSSSGGASTTAATLGYYELDDVITYPASEVFTQAVITIDSTNNMLDFEEIDGLGFSSGELNAYIQSGTYRSIADLETAIEDAMNDASAASGYGATYDVTYDEIGEQFTIQWNGGTALNELHLLWDSGINTDESIGEVLGFDTTADDDAAVISISSDTAPVLMQFDSTNNAIDFVETDADGTLSDQVSVEIPEGDYTNLDQVATAIQAALREASPNNVDYTVSYDYATGAFMVKGSDAAITSFSLLWDSGDNASASAAAMLGFDPARDNEVTFSQSDVPVVNITIDGTNNKIDFKEIIEVEKGLDVSEMTAEIATGVYTDYSDLAHEMEKALEAESLANGNAVDYSVTYDDVTKRFSIKEAGTSLEEFQLLWGSGTNSPTSQGGTGQSIGSIIGFDGVDDVEMPVESTKEVSWGIFDTLTDLVGYLETNDVDGIQRTIGRLEMDYDTMTSTIADIGLKYNRLEARETIISELNVSLKERRSSIEDADIAESIMNLTALETAYEAALYSTSTVLKVSLMDYL